MVSRKELCLVIVVCCHSTCHQMGEKGLWDKVKVPALTEVWSKVNRGQRKFIIGRMGCEDGGVVGGIRLGRLARETSQPTLLSLTLR